ncbi:MAG: DUF4124 domain-containing protein [Proteobacteria bacterium]|nr:DUF4124 domain-containing protein [Pseudomonadota bacterium]
MTRFHPSTPLRCYLTYALLVTTQQVAAGDIFTWLSPDGSTVFSDRPPMTHDAQDHTKLTQKRSAYSHPEHDTAASDKESSSVQPLPSDSEATDKPYRTTAMPPAATRCHQL